LKKYLKTFRSVITLTVPHSTVVSEHLSLPSIEHLKKFKILEKHFLYFIAKLTKYFRNIRVVHVGTSFEDFSPFIFCPNHES
jgi:hypothetical protein